MALVALGCAREVHLTRPVETSPAPDATLKVALDRVLATHGVMVHGLTEKTVFIAVLAVTNAGREPYVLNAASVSCWLELAPDRPSETRSFVAESGGEGAPDSSPALRSTVIPPGETRRFWVKFKTYSFPGSEVPRKITIFVPDARGRPVALVVADPAYGQRWQAEPPPVSFAYGAQFSSLRSSELDGSAVAGQFALIGSLGSLLWDVSWDLRMLHQAQGRLTSETSGFYGIGVGPHLTVPFVRFGTPQTPFMLGIYGGGEAHHFTEIIRPGSGELQRSYGALSAEGGVEVGIGGRPPAQSPFPISFVRPPLPTLTVRGGYARWLIGGNDATATSGGLTATVRLTW